MDDPRAAAAAAIAGDAGHQALGALRNSWTPIGAHVQRGPAGMSWVCFIGGLVTFAFGLLGFINIFDMLLGPLYFMVNAYQMLFGMCTCLIEAPTEWVRTSPKIQQAQSCIQEYAKFLTTFGGRGFFYLFQGSLALSLTGVSLQFILGCYMMGCGVLCLAAQCGFITENMGLKSDARPPQNGYIRIDP